MLHMPAHKYGCTRTCTSTSGTCHTHLHKQTHLIDEHTPSPTQPQSTSSPPPPPWHLPYTWSPYGWQCSWCPQTSRTWASGAPRCRSRSAHCVYPHAGARAAGCAASAPAAPLPPWPWQSQRRHRHVSMCCLASRSQSHPGPAQSAPPPPLRVHAGASRVRGQAGFRAFRQAGYRQAQAGSAQTGSGRGLGGLTRGSGFGWIDVGLRVWVG